MRPALSRILAYILKEPMGSCLNFHLSVVSGMKQIRRNRSVKSKFSSVLRPLAGVAAACLISTSVWSGGNDKVEGIDYSKVEYHVPDNLQQMTDKEISELKASHETNLTELQGKLLPREVAEAHMFEQLMHYCDVGLEIVDVIPDMIDRYHIEGEFRQKLMTFRETFQDDIAPIRHDITNLQQFKSYDFRFKLAYLALIHALQQEPGIAEKMEADSKDENSALGKYKHELADAYQDLQVAKAEMDVMFAANDLQNVIAALDEELARRGQH